MKKVILKVKDLACPDCAAKIGSGMFFHEVSVILVILNGMRKICA